MEEPTRGLHMVTVGREEEGTGEIVVALPIQMEPPELMGWAAVAVGPATPVDPVALAVMVL